MLSAPTHAATSTNSKSSNEAKVHCVIIFYYYIETCLPLLLFLNEVVVERLDVVYGDGSWLV